MYVKRRSESVFQKVQVIVLLVSCFATYSGEWRQYVAATHHPNSNYCISIQNSGKNWPEPGVTQDDNHNYRRHSTEYFWATSETAAAPTAARSVSTALMARSRRHP